MSFLSQRFADKYQRNNKQTGVKNLRCFPVCAPEGHQSNGFCGRGVQLIFEPGCKLLLAEFTQITSKLAFQPGHILNIETLKKHPNMMVGKPQLAHGEPDYDWTMDNIGDVIKLCNEVFQYSQQGQTVVELRVRRGWHYDWVSNRHTCMNLHCLRAYMFEILTPNDVRCITVLDSPHFQVYSRRRSLRNNPNQSGGMRSWPSATSGGSEHAKSESGDSADEEDSSEEKQEELNNGGETRRTSDPLLSSSAHVPPGLISQSQYRILRPWSSSASTGSAMDTEMRGPSNGSGSKMLMRPPSLPSTSSSMYGSPQHRISSSYLSQLLEFVEMSDQKLLRVDVCVSPFVFAKAIEGINPTLYDGANADFLFRLKATRPAAPVLKKTFCMNVATHIVKSQALSAALLTLPLHARSHADLMCSFLTVVHEAFVEYSELAHISMDTWILQFRSASPTVAQGIFHPLFPTDGVNPN